MEVATRKIAHIDMDCFYAAIEMRDEPSLASRPVAVGGDPSGRGVLCTCNYKAREFGVRSAMPSSLALRLCPDLVLLPVAMAKYKRESMRIAAILQRYSDRIEPLSLDEAYMDLTGNAMFSGSATRIMADVRRAIWEETGLRASAGIAPNKFLAKIASDWNKPNWQFTITPTMIQEFMPSLSVNKLPGVGKVFASRLESDGIRTCGDLQTFSVADLARRYGSMGPHLFQLCRGKDDRPVQTKWVRRSLTVETTFQRDILGIESCQNALLSLHAEFLTRLERWRSANATAPWTEDRFQIVIKIKYADFVQTTAERSVPDLESSRFLELLHERYALRGGRVRLLGLGIRMPKLEDVLQLKLPLSRNYIA